MDIHELKSWPDFFTPLFDGKKNFELRLDDRHYKVGDVLLLREYDDRTGKYTGREIKRIVTYKLDGAGHQGVIQPLQGLISNYCILSLEPVIEWEKAR